MGFFEQFPYINSQNLNVDWALGVIKHAEDMMRNLNERIETVVRPIINENQQFVNRQYAEMKRYISTQLNNVESDMGKMEGRVDKKLYDSWTKLNKISHDIDIKMAENTSMLQTDMSNLQNSVNNLISRYDAIWSANSVAANSQVKKLIDSFTHEYQLQLMDNANAMQSLKTYVNNSVAQIQSELSDTQTKLQTQMHSLNTALTSQMDENISVLREMGAAILAECERQAENYQEFYNKYQLLLNDFQNINQSAIAKKADLSYVMGELERLEKLIETANADISVINPSTGQLDSLQQTLFDIYGANSPWSLTAEEYDSLNLRASEYDEISNDGMSASFYDNLGRWFLVVSKQIVDTAKAYTDAAENRVVTLFGKLYADLRNDVNHHWEFCQNCCKSVNKRLDELMYMSSPFDGVRRPLKDVILQMFDKLYLDTLTSDEYDSLSLSADDYDAKAISAYNYDWNGKTILA